MGVSDKKYEDGNDYRFNLMITKGEWGLAGSGKVGEEGKIKEGQKQFMQGDTMTLIISKDVVIQYMINIQPNDHTYKMQQAKFLFLSYSLFQTAR